MFTKLKEMFSGYLWSKGSKRVIHFVSALVIAKVSAPAIIAGIASLSTKAAAVGINFQLSIADPAKFESWVVGLVGAGLVLALNFAKFKTNSNLLQ